MRLKLYEDAIKARPKRRPAVGTLVGVLRLRMNLPMPMRRLKHLESCLTQEI